MAKPIFTLIDLTHNLVDYRVLKFEIPDNVTTPMEFAEAVADLGDQLSGAFVVLINGRGPMWGYAMLVHLAHPSWAIATYDPRLGYVVVETHDARFSVGQVLADPLATEIG